MLAAHMLERGMADHIFDSFDYQLILLSSGIFKNSFAFLFIINLD
jgi:hypothetical protein